VVWAVTILSNPPERPTERIDVSPAPFRAATTSNVASPIASSRS
jgi:hypothetical protein